MLEINLHLHSSEDPHDILGFDGRHAATLQFDAIAITPHGKVIKVEGLHQFATQQGVLLIPGIEKRIFGKELLVARGNPVREPGDDVAFDDLNGALRRVGLQVGFTSNLFAESRST